MFFFNAVVLLASFYFAPLFKAVSSKRHTLWLVAFSASNGDFVINKKYFLVIVSISSFSFSFFSSFVEVPVKSMGIM